MRVMLGPLFGAKMDPFKWGPTIWVHIIFDNPPPVICFVGGPETPVLPQPKAGDGAAEIGNTGVLPQKLHNTPETRDTPGPCPSM